MEAGALLLALANLHIRIALSHRAGPSPFHLSAEYADDGGTGPASPERIVCLRRVRHQFLSIKRLYRSRDFVGARLVNVNARDTDVIANDVPEIVIARPRGMRL
jgi:hypothetical protein